MKRRYFLKGAGTAGLLTLISPTSIVHALSQSVDNGLEQSFVNPPAIARPYTWWHWMNGNITKKGITLDLEAMQRVGIGGVQCFNVGTNIPKGPVDYLSNDWIDLTRHAIAEAGRLGLEFDMHNCPGWSSTGGPWITPELSMQQLVWTESLVEGGRTIQIHLPKPFTKLDYYQDTYVIAYPALEGESTPKNQLSPKVSTNQGSLEFSKIDNPDLSGGAEIHPTENKQPGYLLLEYPAPFEARSLTLFCAPLTAGLNSQKPLELQYSNNGQDFIKISEVKRVGSNIEMPATLSFDAVKARFYRLIVPLSLRIAAFRLSGAARVLNWPTKANFPGAGSAGTQLNASVGIQSHLAYDFPDQSVIKRSSVIDLTSLMDAEGRLVWEAPSGNWSVLRFGHTPIGRKNNAAPESGSGLECDKYSSEAYNFHFHKMMDALLPALKAIMPASKVGMLVDSYEVGLQNWTKNLPEQFRKRRDYDFVSFLPALTGRVVESTDITERFLWDFRKTHADLMADNYHGYFAKLCRENGILAYTEPYNNGPFQQMEVGSRVDINMGEFWIRNPHFNPSVKLASSIAHIYGKRIGNREIVGAEAFTGEPVHSKWQEHPYVMKAQGDLMYTKGLNRFIFHRFAHQPHPTAAPGMTMGPWGFHFDRTNTWFEESVGWLRYASRCQSLLQQGNFVADLLYFTGEDIPGDDLSLMYQPEPAPPKGYDFDFVDPQALLQRIEVKNHRIVLPDQTQYRLMVLQDKSVMSVEVLRKLYLLVKKGMILSGPPPKHTPGLANSVSNDKELNVLIQKLWGADFDKPIDRQVGQGRVFSGIELNEVLERVNIVPDFIYSTKSGTGIINYIHRCIGDTDIYFVANRLRTTELAVTSFRIQGKSAELWHPDTGEISTVNFIQKAQGKTTIALPFDPAGSYFVIFRPTRFSRSLKHIELNGKPLITTTHFQEKLALYPNIANSFTISVWVKPEVEENFAGPYLYNRGISSNVFYPPEGKKLYGANHAACGLVAARNGLAVYERSLGYPSNLQYVLVPISGWNHITLIYSSGVPMLYLNGRLVFEGVASGKIIHPGAGVEKEDKFSWFFEGDKSSPEVYSKVLSVHEISETVRKGVPAEQEVIPVKLAKDKNGGILFLKNGNYTLVDDKERRQLVSVTEVSPTIDLSSSWNIKFPPNLGAPEQVTLPYLHSLHEHEQEGVKYFSGTCTYTKEFQFHLEERGDDQKLYLSLGSVAVIARVKLNGKDMGLLWKRPFEIDVTDAIKDGNNRLEIQVTNLWVNRLIGDEQLPPENIYSPTSRGGAILKLPEWYLQGKPKPAGGRVAFTTWSHFQAGSPLVESGLIGPVKLYSAVKRIF